ACTGKAGLAAVATLTAQPAQKLGIRSSEAVMSSTGVIGHLLPTAKISAKLDELAAGLSAAQGDRVARAIMTTDAFPKIAAASCRLGGKKVTLYGFAKGAGMIHPNMATMLAYVFTDAKVAKATLQKLTARVTATTFNAIVVDGDMSTNDSLFVMASGKAGNGALSARDEQAFASALEKVCRELAVAMVRDGEGASRMMELTVTGAKSATEAKIVAKSVARSQLLQCALFGGDPNWGRIVAAVGYSGIPLDADKVTVKVGKVMLVKNGMPFQKAPAKLFMDKKICCTINLNRGKASTRVWFSDLTYRYVTVNSAYHT
ncbi:MAG TPA: bifunctional glutamate N-acetyltransferase/amino-acid acetyltransferase ArgJ, partial [bacterium]|nr:bifunctional glutamate N-acetyltransferase/amino-acid acetyltransferase ArgJ [bacterium]